VAEKKIGKICKFFFENLSSRRIATILEIFAKV
jgi:hypothetical protein